MIDKSSRIIVTGASGLVGQALVGLLQKSGYSSVLGLSSKDADLRIESQVDEIFLDFRPDVVFHLAAKVFGLGGNLTFGSDVLVDNVRMNTSVVTSATKAQSKKIVAMGSGCVYPDFENNEPVTEAQVWAGPPHPSEGPYAHSKRLMLAHLEANRAQYGTEFAFAISGNLYGPGDNFNTDYGHVIPSLVAKFHQAKHFGGNVNAWGTGAAVRDFTYSEDMARALLSTALHASGPINVGSGFRHSIREIVEELQRLTGVDVSWDSAKPDGQLARFYDLSKLRKTGFQAEIDLVEGISRTYQWYSDNFPSIRR